MTLDGNKDEAQKCINIAISAIREGQIDRAEKFLLKAERLYPTPQAKELLKGLSSANINKSNGDTAENVQSEARKRKPAPQQPQPAPREYTVEQMESVRRINKCKDFYELLGVTKSAPDGEVKKAYKKLALQLHPDKNHAPGAGEAFKAIGNAAAVLTDPERRKQYDLRGDESTHTPAQHSRHQYYARGFESDLTAEELFNMFFGAGGQHVYTRRRYQQREPQEGQREGSNSLLQLLPVLFLVVISMMSGFFINDPVFSLSPSSKFPVSRETLNLKIPYYVKDNFHSDYQGSLRRLEITIEEEFLLNLRHACQRERNYKETMTWKARNFGDNKQFQAAQKMATPSCDRLYTLSQR